VFLELPVLTSNRVSIISRPGIEWPKKTGGNYMRKARIRTTKRNYDPGLYKRRLDPAYAMKYLNAALADDAGADAVHYLSLLDVARANQMTYIAESTGIKREDLFKTLARCGGRGINSLRTALDAISLRLPGENRGKVARRTVAACIRNFSDPAPAAIRKAPPNP
jgi:DNA-binding phage protein